MLLPDHWPLTRAGKGDRLVGPVLLAAPASTVGIRAELVEEGHLVLRGEVESLSDMADADKSLGTEEIDALVENVGEVPVVVRVDLGEATMTARQWASLGKGDVIALGKRLGEHVVLRVGGVPVATGELVEVDGQVGVRIIARTATGTTAG
jgi:flagellar motor switch/type III secretory pathway protein FliN